MRAFVVLCLIALASADKLGYNYHPVGHSDAGLSFAPGAGSSGSGLLSGSIGGGSIGGGSIGGGSISGGFVSGGSLGGGSIGGGSIGGGSIGGGSLGGISLGGGDSDFGAGSVGDGGASYGGGELEKEFYTFSANDNDFESAGDAERISNSLKRNLQVVFIRGPENRALENAAVNLAKHASDQQTAIYVLSKQADLAELANRFNAAHDARSQRPEVHFVKYRTAQDAALAQHTIQSQYDALGGSSQSHDGGVAPVLNFASQAPAGHVVQNGFANLGGLSGSSGSGIGSIGGISGGAVIDSEGPGSSYLPASILRRLRV